ncbi:hypothetical protein, partial [Candidatus Ichthyocystis sparus]|uniref:hypothetical protein n=1 Tax=Candidatus Ichthyocystis sparus TaxID=1561004 RepID=UPI00159ED00E
MYPVSSVISSVAASSVVTESGNDTSNNVNTAQGDDLHPVDVTTSATAVGHVVSTKSKGKAPAQKHVSSVAVSSSAAATGLSPIIESEPGSLSKTQPSSSSTTTTSITATTVGKEVSTRGRGRGRAIAQKPVTSTVVSPPAATVSQRDGTPKPSKKRELKKLSAVGSEDFSRAADAVSAPPIVEFSIRNYKSKRIRKSGLKKLSDVSSEDFSRAADAVGATPMVELSIRSDISKRSREHGLKNLREVTSEDFSRAIDNVGAPIVGFSIGRDTSNLSRNRAIENNASATIDLSSCGINFRKILPKPSPGVSDQRDSVSAAGNVSNVVESPVDTGSSLPIIFLVPLPQPQSQPVFSVPLASVFVTDTLPADISLTGGTGGTGI